MDYLTIYLILCVAFSVLWIFTTTNACVWVGLVFSLSLDIHTIWRKALVMYFCKVRRRFKPKKLMDPNIFKVLCLPTDVDPNLQLTHGRLLRECDFGQTEFWVENYTLDALRKMKGKIRVDAYHVTYDTPIKVFETFKIIAKILYWDDSRFYMKQTVIRNSDKKECASILSIHRVSGVTTSELLNSLNIDHAKNRQIKPDIVRKFEEINDFFSLEIVKENLKMPQ